LLDHYALARRQNSAPQHEPRVVDLNAGVIEPAVIEASDG
jgi:hypothetical protein